MVPTRSSLGNIVAFAFTVRVESLKGSTTIFQLGESITHSSSFFSITFETALWILTPTRSLWLNPATWVRERILCRLVRTVLALAERFIESERARGKALWFNSWSSDFSLAASYRDPSDTQDSSFSLRDAASIEY